MVAFEHMNTSENQEQPQIVEVKPMETLTPAQNQKLIATYFPDNKEDFEGADFSALQYLVGKDKMDVTLKKYSSVITPKDIDDIQEFVTLAEENYQDDIAKLQSFVQSSMSEQKEAIVLGFGEDKKHQLGSQLSPKPSVDVEPLPSKEPGALDIPPRVVKLSDGTEITMPSHTEEQSPTNTTSEIETEETIEETVEYAFDIDSYLKGGEINNIDGKEINEHQQQVLRLEGGKLGLAAFDKVLDVYQQTNPTAANIKEACNTHILTPAKRMEEALRQVVSAREEKYMEIHHQNTQYGNLNEQQKKAVDTYAVQLFDNAPTTKEMLTAAADGTIDINKYVGTGNNNNAFDKSTIKSEDKQNLQNKATTLMSRLKDLTSEQVKTLGEGMIASFFTEEKTPVETQSLSETMKGGISSLKDFIAMIADILFDAGLLKEGGDSIWNRVRNERLQAQTTLDTYEEMGVEALKGIHANVNNATLDTIFTTNGENGIDKKMSSTMAASAYTKKFGEQGPRYFMASHIMQTLYGEHAKDELAKIVTKNGDMLEWQEGTNWNDIQEKYQKKMEQACGVTEEGLAHAKTMNADVEADMLYSSLMKGNFAAARKMYTSALDAYKEKKPDTGVGNDTSKERESEGGAE